MTQEALASQQADGIALSERAAKELGELIASQGKPGAGLRVWVAGGGCSGLSYGMALDDATPEEGDKVFEQNGIRIPTCFVQEDHGALPNNTEVIKAT